MESTEKDQHKVNEALRKTIELRKHLNLLRKEMNALKSADQPAQTFHYPETPLTKRELEVLQLIKKGLTNDRIGKALYIAERTVKFHITSILSKLHAQNRTEAVDIALKRGFLEA